VVRPDGEVVVAAGARAGLVTAAIDPGALHDAGRRIHHLEERRPGLYRSMGAPAPPPAEDGASNATHAPMGEDGA
jgi:hypothetical protein